MDRVTRKGLKRDKFAQEVQHGLEFVGGHRKMFVRYGSIAAAVVLLVGGFLFYRGRQSSARLEAVESAMKIENAIIGPAQTEYQIAYPSEAEKNKAARKAWSDLATRYSGTNEAVYAEYFLAGHAADDGNLQEAQRRFQTVIDSGKTECVSFARLALAQVYGSQGKVAEGEKLIRSLIDHPTTLVSKEAATIALAHLVAPTDPGRARKLLESESLRGSQRSEVSKAAIQALSDLK